MVSSIFGGPIPHVTAPFNKMVAVLKPRREEIFTNAATAICRDGDLDSIPKIG